MLNKFRRIAYLRLAAEFLMVSAILLLQCGLFCVRVGAYCAVPAQVVLTPPPVAPPTVPVATPVSVALPQVSHDDTIEPDDVVDISVVGEPDLTRSITIPLDGKITYSYVSELRVTGLTVREVRQRITTLVAKQIVDPEVIVSISKRHDRTASVLGAVKTPGKFVIVKEWHLLDLLAESGGLTSGIVTNSGLASLRPEWATATLVRGDQVTPVNLLRLMTMVDPKENVPVLPGDILIVREVDQAQTQVQVLGEVVHPGTLPVPSDGSLAAVLATAGGPTPQAALTKATILRGTQTIPVNLQSLMIDGKAVTGVTVQPGDTLIVPTNKRLFAVFGAVTKPGATPYPEDQKLDVLSALALAGGQTTNADLKNVVLVRQVPGVSKPETTNLNLWDAMRKGDMSQNLAVQPGDILFIPDKGGDRHLQAANFVNVVPSFLYLFR